MMRTLMVCEYWYRITCMCIISVLCVWFLPSNAISLKTRSTPLLTTTPTRNQKCTYAQNALSPRSFNLVVRVAAVVVVVVHKIPLSCLSLFTAVGRTTKTGNQHTHTLTQRVFPPHRTLGTKFRTCVYKRTHAHIYCLCASSLNR